MTCALDRMGSSSLEAWAAEAKARYGVSDATVRRAMADLATANTKPLAERLDDCAAIKRTRWLRAMHIVVLLADLWTLGKLLVARGSQKALWERLALLGLLNTVFIAAEYRHALSVGLKITWHGFGTGARLALALILLGVASTTVLEYVQEFVSGWVLTGLILVTGAVTLAKTAYLVKEVVHPEPTAFDAMASVLDHTVTKESIAAFKARLARTAA
jgi:hypothetical protein